MLTTNVINEIIESAYSDIRAEAVIASLVEGDIELGDLVAVQEGNFKRRYSRDISKVDTLRLQKDLELLAIHMNRDGLYDALPEGLFHTKTANDGAQSKKWSDESVKLRQEEKAARNFFRPIENELFHQRVKLELEERNILAHFSENIFSSLYPNLWGLPHSIDREYIYRMILMLHVSHQIVGDFELTAQCLGSIIDEDVEVRFINPGFVADEHHHSLQVESQSKLGHGTLGVDFVCDSFVDHSINDIEFVIGPLQNTKVEHYLYEAPLTQFLKCFYNYFIPVEMEVKTKVLVDDKDINFVLEEGAKAPVLGFETAI